MLETNVGRDTDTEIRARYHKAIRVTVDKGPYIFGANLKYKLASLVIPKSSNFLASDAAVGTKFTAAVLLLYC